MTRPKPIEVELRFGLIIGLIVIVTAIIGTFSEWKEFYDLIAPDVKLALKLQGKPAG